MHDIDRTQLENNWETNGYEMEGEGEQYDESYDEFYGGAEEMEGIFDEIDEMELAADLLEINDEAELEQFLGRLVKRAGRTLGSAIRSPQGRALTGILKGVARKALPKVGSALGNLVVPGAGGAYGSKVASTAGRMFGLELEGMSVEDQEFEVARRLVRLAGDAVQNAAQLPSSIPPVAAAQNAVAAAAQKHAPGLLRGSGASSGGPKGGRRQSGRWQRRGRTIVLLGV
jgi:hypothetical protein